MYIQACIYTTDGRAHSVAFPTPNNETARKQAAERRCKPKQEIAPLLVYLWSNVTWAVAIAVPRRSNTSPWL